MKRKRAKRIGMLCAAWLAGWVHAAVPDYQVDSAQGSRLLLWVSSERGRSEPETVAAHKLALQGVTVWSLDVPGAFFLPQLPSSMDKASPSDVAEWLVAALDTGKQLTVYAVGRAAVPILRAAALLETGQRGHMCMLLMYPNLYQSAEALSDADYLDTGRLDGLAIRLLQPRRSAATPWLPAQVDHLSAMGARVTPVMLENVREGFWARETPTAFEIEQAGQMDKLILQELESCR